MTQATEINHQVEAMIAENQGHEVGCWDELIELAIEQLAARGASWLTGASTEVVDGRTLAEWAVELVTGRPDACTCSEQYAALYAEA